MVFSVEGVVLESFPFKMANSYEFAAVGGEGDEGGLQLFDALFA